MISLSSVGWLDGSFAHLPGLCHIQLGDLVGPQVQVGFIHMCGICLGSCLVLLHVNLFF